MNSINSSHQLHKKGLGSFTDIFSAGAGLVDSFVDARAERKSDESDERQLALTLEAQREQAQMQAATLHKILKFAAIAGSVLVVGVVIVTVIKSDSPDVDKKPAGDGPNSPEKSPVLAGMKRKGETKKVRDRKSVRSVRTQPF